MVERRSECVNPTLTTGNCATVAPALIASPVISFDASEGLLLGGGVGKISSLSLAASRVRDPASTVCRLLQAAVTETNGRSAVPHSFFSFISGIPPAHDGSLRLASSAPLVLEIDDDDASVRSHDIALMVAAISGGLFDLAAKLPLSGSK